MKFAFAAAAAAATLLATSAGAATIGTIGSSFANNFLNANGHTASTVSANAASLAGLDAVILHRSGMGNQDVIDFVANGGLLITEWSASVWALNTAGLLDATDTGGGLIGTGTPITFTAAGQATNLDDQSGPTYNTAGPASEFFRTFTNIGSDVDVLATRPGDEAVILAGTYGLGTVLIMGYDWQDQLYADPVDTGNEQVLLQAVEFQLGSDVAPVPLPASGFMLLGALGGVAALRRQKA